MHGKFCAYPIDQNQNIHTINKKSQLMDRNVDRIKVTAHGETYLHLLESCREGQNGSIHNSFVQDLYPSNVCASETLETIPRNHRIFMQRSNDRLTLNIWSPCRLSSFDQDPTGSLQFLLEFTKDAGLTHSFETDNILHRSGIQKHQWDLSSIFPPFLNRPEQDIELQLEQLLWIPDSIDGDDYFWQPKYAILPYSSTEYPQSQNYLYEGITSNDDLQVFGDIQIPPLPLDDLGSNACYPTNYTEAGEIVNVNQWYNEPLATKTAEIVRGIRDVSIGKTAKSIVSTDWSPTLEALCIRFFSPPTLRYLLDTYWKMWYPNWPVIHKPTFDACRAPPTLVAAMALIGACHSSEVNYQRIARLWFNSVEEWVFNDPYAIEALTGLSDRLSSSAASTRLRVQAIQAAYAVCIYQNWDGTNLNKRRIRRYRFTAIVAVGE